MEHLILFAATESPAQKPDLFGVLGIDWKLLLLQTIAFLLMLWILKRFAYPPLNRALEERQKTIESSLQAAKEAETKAEKSQAEVEKMLKEAQTQASEIVATAKTEATAAIEAAEAKARTKAQRVLDQAHEQVEQDIEAARKALRKDTIELVAMATEKVVRAKTTAGEDEKLIQNVVKEVQA